MFKASKTLSSWFLYKDKWSDLNRFKTTLDRVLRQ
jgi:hypothetical protein